MCARPGRQATLLVDGTRVGLLPAVHVNAHRANALDAEETIRHSGHAAAATVLPALAVAEQAGSSGTEFAAAVCVGFDVAARIALSLRTLDTTPDGRTVISPVAGSSWAAFAATVAAGCSACPPRRWRTPSASLPPPRRCRSRGAGECRPLPGP